MPLFPARFDLSPISQTQPIMSSVAPIPPVSLIYGNQPYAVEQAAGKRVDAVLGEDLPRDFALQRFDASEIMRGGNSEVAAELFGGLQAACETAPFLCERWVVRIDHLEAVKGSDRAAQNIVRALGELMVFPTVFEGEEAWATEEDLLPTDSREGPARPLPWVGDVAGRAGNPTLLRLKPEAAEVRCLLSHGGKRRLVGVREFLGRKLKGKFVFAGDEDTATQGEASGARGSIGNRLHQWVERIAGNPPEGLHLVCTAVAGRETDLSKPLVAAFKKAGPIDKFVTYDDHEPVDWVVREAESRGARLNPPLAALLIHLVGNDLGRLAGEVDKLALLFPALVPGTGQPAPLPSEDDLVRAAGGGATASLFLITEKLGQKDLPGALSVLEHFLQETPGEHPMLLGILARHTRQMLQWQTFERLGLPENVRPQRLKLHPFIARKLGAQARRFSITELEGMLHALADLDLGLKLHGHLTGPLLRDYIQAVCGGGFRRPRPHPATTSHGIARGSL